MIETTAKGRYYKVFVGTETESRSQHTTEREAIQKCTEILDGFLQNGVNLDRVYYVHDYEVDVTINANSHTMRVGNGGVLEHVPASNPSTLEYDIPISASAEWVSTTGSDITGDGSQGNPYATLRHALDQLSGPGEICVADGTYTITNSNKLDWMINDRATSGYSPLPSGTGWASRDGNGFPTDRSNMVFIRAETVHGVKFQSSASTYYDEFMRCESAQYVSVDGFIFETTHTSPLPNRTISTGDNNYVSRCIVKRAACNDAGGFIDIGLHSLVEMCSVVGAARYGINCGSLNQKGVARLCVARVDFTEFDGAVSGYPHAPFNFYGNPASEMAWLNCLAIDGNDTGYDGNANRVKWGGYYSPHLVSELELRGFMVINEGTYYSGIWPGESASFNVTLEDCVIWNIYGNPGNPAGLRFNGSGSGNTANRLTIGNTDGSYVSNTGTMSITNTRQADTLNGTDPSVMYQSDGADARYMFGQLGDRYGDVGYNTKSTTPVLPWPYEDTIKTVFTEQLNPPSGYFPTSNTSNRGFCTAASLSDYIVKYVNAGTVVGDIY